MLNTVRAAAAEARTERFMPLTHIVAVPSALTRATHGILSGKEQANTIISTVLRRIGWWDGRMNE
jgi:hypothetical protein